MNTVKLFILVFFGSAIVGCGSLSKDQCKTQNWFELGRQDGSTGAVATSADERIKACSDQGVAVDKNLYINGRNEGLKYYCTESMAIQMGRERKKYEGVCEGKLDATFRHNHRVGENIARLDDEKKKLEETNDEHYRQMGQSGLQKAEKRQLESKARINERRLRTLISEIKRLEKKYKLQAR